MTADTGLQETDLAEARQLLAQGRMADGVRLYEAILERHPQQGEALNAVALWAIRGGNIERGIRLLEQALIAAPQDPLTLHHLAQARQAEGDAPQALKLYRRALLAKPDLFVARLALAHMLEGAGRAQEALPHYFRAITDAQREGRWMSRESTPQALQEVVQHAMRSVNQGRRQLYDQLLQPLRERFGVAALRRVEDCLQVYLGERRPEYPDPRQKPTFLYFPGLPASPYLERTLVPQLESLENSTAAIQQELAALLSGNRGREAVFQTAELESANLAGYRGAPGWNGYYFHRHGVQRPENCAACPQTEAALNRLPLCRVRDHGPETLFSVLTAGTHLLPHRGVTNTRVVGHLALIVPPDCALRVAEREYVWKVGEAVLFDDTYMHEAWNRSAQTRVVLIFDLWNPHLTEVERMALTELIGAIGDFRAAAEIRDAGDTP